MENIIKGLHLLKDLAKPDIDAMEQAALRLWQQFAVTFKFVEYGDKSVTIQVAQDRNQEKTYFDRKFLIGMVHQTFDAYFPSKKILVNPIPFVPNPTEVVNSVWIKDRMLKTGCRLKTIAEETGLNMSYLSTLTNGVDPLSEMAKAMFYYYFLSKEEKEPVRSKEKKDKS
jgi:hypothetical protein